MTTKCPVEEWEETCEIASTDEGEYSEPALKQIPNLKNLITKYPRGMNFPNQRGKSGTKTHFAIAEIAANFAIVTNGNPVDEFEECEEFCEVSP